MIKKIKSLLVFILLLLGMYCFPYIPMELFSLDYQNFSQNMKVIYTVVCDIGFMVIICFLYKDILLDNLKKYFKNFQINFETSFKYYFLGVIIMVVSNYLIYFFFKEATANNEEAIRSMIKLYPAYMVFSVSIYAPIVEELIFRKSIKDMVMVWGNNKITKYIYILASGLIFASLHVVGSVTSNLDYLYIIPYSALGLAFSSLYYKTDNIFSTISMHMLHNTFTILLYFVIGV